MSNIEYTDPNRAVEIVGNNRTDTRLERKLRDFLGGDFDDVGPFTPYALTPSTPAVMAEYLAWTARSTVEYSLAATALGLKPNIVTYRKDEANTTNPKKGAMIRPSFALSDPGCQTMRPKLISGKPSDYRPFCTIDTKFGVGLDVFWEMLRQRSADPAVSSVKTSDISDWYERRAIVGGWLPNKPSRAEFYYPSLMGLYTMAAVFVDYDRFPSFRYAEEAFQRAKQELGAQPVIVRWSPGARYTALGQPDRQIDAFTVDLTNTDIKGRDLDPWLEAQVQRAS